MDPLEEDEAAWPDEPTEFDPESLGPDEPDATSNVDSRVRESLGATADMDDEVFHAFWGSVVFLNTALAALSIGALLVYFRGDWTMGGPALLVGTIAAGFTLRFYLRGRRHLREADDGSGDDSGDGSGDGCGDGSGDENAESRTDATNRNGATNHSAETESEP